jgi:hypothetical protein
MASIRNFSRHSSTSPRLLILDLTLTPIHTDMPCVGAYGGCKRKPMIDWIEAHNEFSSTLYALFASQGVIAPAATRFSQLSVYWQWVPSSSGLDHPPSSWTY